MQLEHQTRVLAVRGRPELFVPFEHSIRPAVSEHRHERPRHTTSGLEPEGNRKCTRATISMSIATLDVTSAQRRLNEPRIHGDRAQANQPPRRSTREQSPLRVSKHPTQLILQIIEVPDRCERINGTHNRVDTRSSPTTP